MICLIKVYLVQLVSIVNENLKFNIWWNSFIISLIFPSFLGSLFSWLLWWLGWRLLILHLIITSSISIKLALGLKPSETKRGRLAISHHRVKGGEATSIELVHLIN